MAAIVRIVDAPGAAPTVLLDLSPGSTANGALQLGEGFSAPPPELQRVVADTLLSDGGSIPASAYGFREVKLPVVLPTQLSADARATNLRPLARQLDRPSFWLQVRPDTGTTDYFLRCYRSSAEQINALLTRQWAEASISLEADPFAVGLEQVVAASFQPGTNPTAAASIIDVASPLGDVEAPLLFAQAADGDVPAGIPTILAPAPGWTFQGGRPEAPAYIAVRRRGTPSKNRGVAQPNATASSAGPIYTAVDTLTQTVDAAAWNGSRWQNPMTTSPGNLISRLNVTLPPASTPWAAEDKFGLYRVVARIYFTDSSSTFQLALGDNNGRQISDTYGPMTGQAGYSLIDFGVVQIGPSPDQWGRGYQGQDNADPGIGAAHVDLQVKIARLSGAGTWAIDSILFLPADERLLEVWKASNTLGTAERLEIDGIQQGIRVMGSSGAVIDNQPQAYSWRGGWPSLLPGRANRIFWVGTGGVGVAYRVSYWPRYLWLA